MTERVSIPTWFKIFFFGHTFPCDQEYQDEIRGGGEWTITGFENPPIWKRIFAHRTLRLLWFPVWETIEVTISPDLEWGVGGGESD